MVRGKAWLLLPIVAASVLASVAQDAAMFRGNPQHSGIYAAVGVPKYSGVKWKFATGAAVISSPAVVDNTVYVGSSDHNLYALKLGDGALQWKFKTEGRVVSSPAVSEGVVYFGSYDGNFYCGQCFHWSVEMEVQD